MLKKSSKMLFAGLLILVLSSVNCAELRDDHSVTSVGTVSGLRGGTDRDVGPFLQGKVTTAGRNFAGSLLSASSYSDVNEKVQSFLKLPTKKQKSILDALIIFAIYGDARNQHHGLLNAIAAEAIKITTAMTCFFTFPSEKDQEILNNSILQAILGSQFTTFQNKERHEILCDFEEKAAEMEDGQGIMSTLCQRYQKGAPHFSAKFYEIISSGEKAMPNLPQIFANAIAEGEKTTASHDSKRVLLRVLEADNEENDDASIPSSLKKANMDMDSDDTNEVSSNYFVRNLFYAGTAIAVVGVAWYFREDIKSFLKEVKFR